MAQSSGTLRDRRIFLPESARGDILDRNGQQLTNQGHGWACVVIPKLLMRTAANIDRLAALAQIAPAEINEKIDNANKQGNYLVLLKSWNVIDAGTRQGLSSITGVEVVPIARRYDDSGLLAHIIGTLDEQSDSGAVPRGSSGLEKRYDRYLGGQMPHEAISVVLDGKKEIISGLSPQIQENWYHPERAGVETTIDRRVQKAVEDVMDKKVKSGAVVVLDIKSRDILAICSRPAYNPYDQNIMSAEETSARYLNRALTPFYPGSLFKIAVAAAALEYKTVTLDDIFLCDGAYSFPSQLRIPCWKASGHGWVSISQALAQSCNDAFIQIGLSVGRTRLLEAFRRMHLVDTDVIGYDNSQHGSHITIDYGNPALANASVGQNGVMMTPLQAANMLATIADSGIYKRPRLVRGVRKGEKYLARYSSDSGERVMSQQTSQDILSALRLVTTEGTGALAFVPPWGSGGKTATAQTGQIGADGNEILNTWFVGFFPARQPRWAISIMVERGQSGGRDAAPVFKEIAQKMGPIFLGK